MIIQKIDSNSCQTSTKTVYLDWVLVNSSPHDCRSCRIPLWSSLVPSFSPILFDAIPPISVCNRPCSALLHNPGLCLQHTSICWACEPHDAFSKLCLKNASTSRNRPTAMITDSERSRWERCSWYDSAILDLPKFWPGGERGQKHSPPWIL